MKKIIKKIFIATLVFTMILASCGQVFAAGPMSISYVDEYGELITANNVQYLLPTTKRMENAIYYTDGLVTENRISVCGDVTLILGDESEIIYSGEYSTFGSFITLEAGATLNIYQECDSSVSGLIYSDKKMPVITVGTGSVLNLCGGVIIENDYYYPIYSSNGFINIYDANVYSVGDNTFGAIQIENEAKLILQEGSIVSDKTAVNASSSCVIMTGGTIEGTNIGINSNRSDLEFYGGEISGCETAVSQGNGTTTVGGTIRIVNNTEGIVLGFLDTDIVNISDYIPPLEGMCVGLGNGLFAPNEGCYRALTAAGTAEYLDCFFATDENCVLAVADDCIVNQNRILCQLDEYDYTFEVYSDDWTSQAGNTVEYSWYGFGEPEEINGFDTEYVYPERTYTDADGEFQYTASYDEETDSYTFTSIRKKFRIYNYTDEEVGDLVLNLPANSILSFSLSGECENTNYEIAIYDGEGLYCYPVDYFKNTEAEFYAKDGGTYLLFATSNKKGDAVITDINIRFINDEPIEGQTECTIDGNRLAVGHYVAKATFITNGNVFAEMYSECLNKTEEPTDYPIIGGDADGAVGSVFSNSGTMAIIIMLVVAVAAMVVVLVIKKKKTAEAE